MASTPLLFVSPILFRPSSASFSTTLHSSTAPFSPNSLARTKRTTKRQRSHLFACTVSSTASDASKTDIVSQGSLGALLTPRDSARYVFFGGKGGVGKTTTSCSTAVSLAEKGLRVLLISTDPAHSVSDALDAKLQPGKLTRVEIDPDSSGTLDAVECDPSEAVAEFRQLIASIAPSKDDVQGKNGENSAWKSIADKVKIADFADVLDTIPPGADELIALVRVLDLSEPADSNSDMAYDRIIIDTAPTGHTLRLLAFPDFLEKFLEKALALRARIENARGMLSGIANVFMATTGSKIDRDLVSRSVEEAVKRVEVYRQKMLDLSDLFRDPGRAEFVVVSIATDMAVAESERLIEKLWSEGVWCRHVVVNQLLPARNNKNDAKLEPYLKRMRMSQASHLAFATEQLADVYNLAVSTVPLFDTEVRGVFALRALAAVAFTPARMKKYGKLFQAPSDDDTASSALTTFESSQFAFVGGKGGVGKTSTSAALGVALAQSGHKTLVLSTDPAHSLSDAFDVQLDGVPKKLDTDTELYGMEIDPAKALEEFQNLVAEFARDKEDWKGVGGEMARTLGLGDFASLLDNAPPGIDELVALTQVLELIKYGDFSKVIIDTAPTGHTLRLLAFPEFLDNLLGKLVKLKARLDSALKSLRNAFKSSQTIDMVDNAAERVETFRENMAMLKSLIENQDRTQFVVVTIPTNLAMAESNRLLESLRQDGVQVKNLLVNQVIPDRDAKSFIERIADAQEGCIRRLGRAGERKNIEIVRVPAYDVEVRGVYALRAMGAELFRDEDA